MGNLTSHDVDVVRGGVAGGGGGVAVVAGGGELGSRMRRGAGAVVDEVGRVDSGGGACGGTLARGISSSVSLLVMLSVLRLVGGMTWAPNALVETSRSSLMVAVAGAGGACDEMGAAHVAADRVLHEASSPKRRGGAGPALTGCGQCPVCNG